MKYDHLISLIDEIASDFLFLDGDVIDVPSTGNFLNQLGGIIKEAETLEVNDLKRVASGLNIVLEKTVMEDVDPDKGFHAVEKGITLMQQIGDSFKNTGQYEGNIEEFMEHISDLTGVETLEADDRTQAEQGPQEDTGEDVKEEEKFQIEDEALMQDFITEGLEYIDEIEVNILDLEKNPEDKDCINAIFRPFHSIKGVASFLNLEVIRDLAHGLETLLDQARSDELAVTPALIDIVLDGTDALQSMIGSLKEVLDGSRDRPLVMDLTVLKDRMKNVDKKDVPLAEPKKIGEILVKDEVLSEESLKESLKTSQAEPGKKIGETLIEQGKATPKQVSQALRKQTQQVSEAATVRVDINKLDNLIDMIGELVITQAMIKQSSTIQSSADRKLTRNVSLLEGITSELQRTSTSLRMIPIKQTFQRMSRLVRDLSKNSKKMAVVELVGEDTEIDRNMVEQIYNPLVHMVRNSVDHGLESPAERVKLGKPEKGLIQLKAYHKGGNVVIEIVDDGKGLDKEKILNKAIEKGVIKSRDGISDKEIFSFIFAPGFSTADQVTDVSGRGVGMDVVKQAVDKLRGEIEVHSVENKGTTVTALFPLTMAIIDGMIVKVGNERYIIPTTAIKQLLRPSQDSYNNVVDKGEMLNVMGRLLPLVRVHEIFKVEPKHQTPWDALVVVIEAENRSKCLLVDSVIGKEEVVIKSLGGNLKDVKGITGGAILGDGNVGLILDPVGLFKLSEN